MADLGDWGFFAKVSIQPSEVPSDRTDFPVYVDLSDLDATFFNEVQSDGADIRVTESDQSTLVPREVVAIDAGAETGELWFKAPSISSSTVTDFYIYFGNPSASAPAVTDPNGRNAVWSNGFNDVFHLQEDPGGTAPQFVNSTGGDSLESKNGLSSSDSIQGLIEQAVDFDVADRSSFDGEYVEVKGVSLPTTEGTVSVWFKPEADFTGGHDEALTCIGVAGGNERHMMYLNDNGSLRSLLEDGAGNTIAEYIDTFGSGSWHFATSKWNGSSNWIFYNGVQQGQVSNTKQLSASADQQLAASDDVSNTPAPRIPFAGALDEYRVSNVDRSADWIETEYNNQNSPSSFYSVSQSEESKSLSGSGVGTAQGQGQISVRRSLSGSGVARADGFGTINQIPLAGEGTGTALGRKATLQINRPLSGAGEGTVTGVGVLNKRASMEGTAKGVATGAGSLNVKVDLEGDGTGTAKGEATITGARTFGGEGVARAFGFGFLGDIKSHWVFVDGAIETEDAGSSLNLSGLDPNFVHVFQVAALDTAYNFSVPATLRVSPIALEQASVADDKQTLRITTADPSFYDEIELYRKETQGGSWSLYHTFSDPSQTQEFTDVALDPATSYFYEARGVNSNPATNIKSKERELTTAPLVEVKILSSKVDSEINGYETLVDLSDMPSEFWSQVSEGGGDIRVLDPDGNEVPREVATLDKQAQEGELHFKGDVSGSQDTSFQVVLSGDGAPDPTAQNGRNAVWDRLEAVWHMDEDPGTETGMEDSTGNGNSARFRGDMTAADLIAGKISDGIALDGNDDLLAIQALLLNSQYDEFFAQVWFRTTTDGIILSFDRNEYFRIEIGGSQDNNNFGTSFFANGSTVDGLNASARYDDGSWHRGTFVWNNGTATLYVDGGQEDQDSQGGQLGSQTDRYGFFGVGSEATSPSGSIGPSNFFEVDHDESRMGFTAPTPARIRTSYRNQNDPSSFYSVSLTSTDQLGINKVSSTDTSQTIEVSVEDPSFFTEVRLYGANSQGGPYTLLETFESPSQAQNYVDGGLSDGDVRYYRAEADVTLRAETVTKENNFKLTLLPSSFTLTNQGATGTTGPSSVSYGFESNYADVTAIGDGIQEFTVPANAGGEYRIICKGAEGGRASAGNGEPGGKGARIEGNFTLQAGERIRVAVGQKGTDGDGVGGGGGASHVAKYDPNTDTYTELISAGGGAAGGFYTGGDGEATLSNNDGGGGGCIGSAGFRGNGNLDQLQERAMSFVNGAKGSAGDKGGGDGGFGGGAGSESDASGLNSDDDYGPGGGYEGRDGPCNQAVPGGFSYNDGTNQNNVGGDNTGMGEVTFDLLFES